MENHRKLYWLLLKYRVSPKDEGYGFESQRFKNKHGYSAVYTVSIQHFIFIYLMYRPIMDFS